MYMEKTCQFYDIFHLLSQKWFVVMCFTHVITHEFQFSAPPQFIVSYLRLFSMPVFCQCFFHQNSLNQDSPKFPVLWYVVA